MSNISFYSTVQCPISMNTKPRNPNFSHLPIPKLKSAAKKKVFHIEVSNLKYKTQYSLLIQHLQGKPTGGLTSWINLYINILQIEIP